MIFRRIYLFATLLFTGLVTSQEGIAIYSDYLTDNYYLIHPSMAGASDCSKLRLTGRQQWFGVDNAPALQTLSFNTLLGERSGVGAIVFNDRNGYHSQTGAKLTYAHHLRFSRGDWDLNQLSFGINASFLQNNLDETDFLNSGDFDPAIGGFLQKASYFNLDLGLSYFYLDFFTHVSIVNLLESDRKLYTEFESPNLRRFLWSVGYVFGNDNGWMFEPSTMFQYIDQTKEKLIDVNFKAYKDMEEGRLWGGLSYRKSFDGAEFLDGSGVGEQYLNYISPFVGLNYKNFMFGYTYTHVLGDVKFDNGGYHQLTLGFDFLCKKKGYDCNCPAVN